MSISYRHVERTPLNVLDMEAEIAENIKKKN
jgi:hypothetical protein